MELSLPHVEWGKNVVIFGADNTSFVHADNGKKRYIGSW